MNHAVRSAPPARQLAAEGLGTAVLVLIGLGGGGPLGFGFALFALVVAFGPISGGHFNPAVSVGAAVAGRLSWRDAGRFAGAQVVGGLAGGLILVLVKMTNGSEFGFGDDRLGAPAFGDRGLWQTSGAIILELVFAFVFVLLVLALTDDRFAQPLLAPLGIGLAYAGVGFVLLDSTRSIVNPAAVFATAPFSGGEAIAQGAVFVGVPLVGAALAGFLHPAVFGRDDSGVATTVGASGAAAAPVAPVAEQPIIQDGWQWDPQGERWFPAP